MYLDDLRTYCLSLPHTTEELPFGPDTLVFKVAGKVFAISGLDAIPPGVALKCDPERAVELRERYSAITPAYHMNKQHWNGVAFTGEVPDDEIRALVDHSYALVVAGLPKKVREGLAAAAQEGGGEP